MTEASWGLAFFILFVSLPSPILETKDFLSLFMLLILQGTTAFRIFSSGVRWGWGLGL